MEIREPPGPNDAVADDPRVRLHRAPASPGADVKLRLEANEPEEDGRGDRLYETAGTRDASRGAGDRGGGRRGSRARGGRAALAQPRAAGEAGEPTAPACEGHEPDRDMGEQNEDDGGESQREIKGPQAQEPHDRGGTPSGGTRTRRRGVSSPRHQ